MKSTIKTIFYEEKETMEYIILDDDGNMVSKNTFNRILPSMTSSALRTSEEEIEEATMTFEKVLEFKEKKQQYGWNYRVFEFKNQKLEKMQILVKFQ